LTVILLSGVIWIGSHQLDPRAPISGKSDPLRVDVVALDWKWLFIYPDQGVAAVNELVIPAGTPIQNRGRARAIPSAPEIGLRQINDLIAAATHYSLDHLEREAFRHLEGDRAWQICGSSWSRQPAKIRQSAPHAAEGTPNTAHVSTRGRGRAADQGHRLPSGCDDGPAMIAIIIGRHHS
jgi:hypothetical protein